MISSVYIFVDNILNYNDWKILFTLHRDNFYKQLGAVISKRDKPIALFPIKLSKPQHSYNKTEKELLPIME